MRIGLVMMGTMMAATAVKAQPTVRLITLDPGHFHAALVQKSMYPQVDPTVHVYAKKGQIFRCIWIKSRVTMPVHSRPLHGRRLCMKEMIS